MYRPAGNISDPEVLRELHRLAEYLNTLAAGFITVRHTAPERPRDGQIAICDGTNWNPLGDGSKSPVWFDASDETWKGF